MKKNILIICLFILISTLSFAQTKDFPISEKLKGKVLQTHTTSTIYNEGFPGFENWTDEWEEEIYYPEEEYPDENEDWDDEEEYDEEVPLTVVTYIIEKFDELGRITQKEELSEDKIYTIYCTFEYEEEEQDEKVMTKYFDDQKDPIIGVREESKPGYQKYCMYEKEKKKMELIREWTEKEITITVIDNEGDIKQQTILQYEDGKIMRAINQNIQITDFKYNDQGDVIDEVHSLKVEDKTEEDIHYTYTYEYDNTGNWTKKTNTIKGMNTPYEIIERSIIYY